MGVLEILQIIFYSIAIFVFFGIAIIMTIGAVYFAKVVRHLKTASEEVEKAARTIHEEVTNASELIKNAVTRFPFLSLFSKSRKKTSGKEK